MLEPPAEYYDELVHHDIDGAPDQVCGLLGGDPGDPTARVVSVHPTDNPAATPETEHAIDPAEQYELVEAIEADGHDVVGF